MPYKLKVPCRVPMCPALVEPGTGGYCEKHLHMKPVYKERPRPSSTARGYGWQWQKIRAEVLTRAGIPESEWSLYVVDHRPAYNPQIEPDHRKYELVPMLRADHNRKTARQDGGGWTFTQTGRRKDYGPGAG